ncbi:MAG: dienelactone hydrolase family protein [Akkermansiaceae bacterium]
MKTISKLATSLHVPLIHIPARDVTLYGELDIPAGAPGLVMFAHGSASSRNSPRNRLVAQIIRDAGIGTLLFDLLTHEEEEQDAVTSEFCFDIELLAERLLAATRWVEDDLELGELKIGYFGASTGGGAALLAAAVMEDRVAAVVYRGGRPDLAGEALSKVQCPTLLIVGGLDEAVIELNQGAFAKLRCEKELRIIPGVTHLFEERGKLDHVAQLSAEWFRKHMGEGDD